MEPRLTMWPRSRSTRNTDNDSWGGFSDYAVKNAPTRNFVHFRRETSRDGLAGVYPTVSEVFYDGSPWIAKVESIRATGDGRGAAAPTAVRVTLQDGRETIAVMRGDWTGQVKTDTIRMNGDFACVSLAADGQVERIALVGGTELRTAGFTVEPVVSGYRGTVASLDVPENQVTLDLAWPTTGLAGAVCSVTRTGSDHQTAFNIVGVSAAGNGHGCRIKLRGSLKVYQSAVTHFNDDGTVTLDMPLVLQETDPAYYNGLTVLNEHHDVLGRAVPKPGDRFMYMHKPWHQKWRQTFTSLEEIPDTDGDGKRTLRLVATQRQHRVIPDDAYVEAGETMSVLEITRVAPDGSMIWFRDPPEVYTDSIGVAHRHWPYQDQQLVTEDGKRVLQANYPGDEIYLGLDAGKLGEAQLPDTDGDGRRCVSLAHVAPGDVLEVPSTVSLTQERPGTYRLRANCAVRVQVPGKHTRLALVTGEGVKLVTSGKKGVIEADAALFAQGKVYVILPAADDTISVPL